MRPSSGFLVALALLSYVATAHGQIAGNLLQSGVRAYQNLEFDEAAGFLLRGLSLTGDQQLEFSERSQALSYLGATEIFRGNRDSARAVFGGLVRHDPRFRLDQLVFPPEVTQIFDGVRSSTRVVAIETSEVTAFALGEASFTPWVYASTFHRVTADLLRPDGSVAHSLYSGPVADSLRLEWDGRLSTGNPIEPGRYFLNVASLDPAGEPLRMVRIPLDIAVQRRDTLPHPPSPDSLLLPEKARTGPGVEALAGGILLGVAAVALSSSLVQESGFSGARLMVGGAIGITGIVGFILNRPGRDLPENAVENQRLRATWRENLAAVRRDNALRRGDVRLSIRSGSPQIIERGPS